MADRLNTGNKTWAERNGLTPGKIVFIGVLGVVMLGVYYVQFGKYLFGGGEPAVVSAGPRRPRSARPMAKVDRERAAAGADSPAGATGLVGLAWEAVPLAVVLRHDPFARPGRFPDPATLARQTPTRSINLDAWRQAEDERIQKELDTLRAQLDNLRSQGVQVILKDDNDQYVALMGSQVIRVGQQINGFEVIAINAEGIEVERTIAP